MAIKWRTFANARKSVTCTSAGLIETQAANYYGWNFSATRSVGIFAPGPTTELIDPPRGAIPGHAAAVAELRAVAGIEV